MQRTLSERNFQFHYQNFEKYLVAMFGALRRLKYKANPTTPLKNAFYSLFAHTLRANCGNDSSNSDLNDHLAMNILILISKFIKEDDNDKSNASFDESTVIQYGSLVDLIHKLKRVVFNYHVDDKSNAFIEDTLNVKSFISLLKVKMSSSILPPKSFIDVLLEKGKLGHFDWTKYQLKLISFLIKMMKKDSLMSKT